MGQPDPLGVGPVDAGDLHDGEHGTGAGQHDEHESDDGQHEEQA